MNERGMNERGEGGESYDVVCSFFRFRQKKALVNKKENNTKHTHTHTRKTVTWRERGRGGSVCVCVVMRGKERERGRITQIFFSGLCI